MQLRGEANRSRTGLAIVRRLLEQDPDAPRARSRSSAGAIAEHAPEAGFKVVELAAERAVAENDWAAARRRAAGIRDARAQPHSGADAAGRNLRRRRARSDDVQRAGAAGRRLHRRRRRRPRRGSSPRTSWRASRGSNSNIERFRRALELLGEPDPDGADRQPAERRVAIHEHRSPARRRFAAVRAARRGEDRGGAGSGGDVVEPVVEEPPVKKPPKAQPKRHPLEAHQFQLSANAIDLDSILGDLDSPAASPAAHAETENESEVELDLSLMLEDSATPPPPKKSGTGG